MSKTKLFPIPYAGASVNVYYGWKRWLPQEYELCLIELAGRGSRYNEDFFQSVNQMAADIAERIIEQLTEDDEYILFGHSMGALLAYEVYYELQNRKIKIPKHIIFSGRRAPQILCEKCNTEEMNDKAFLDMVEELGGIQTEFYKEEIVSVFLPILRSDFTIIDDYLYQSKDLKIECDVSVLYSVDDVSMSLEEALMWKEVCNKKVLFYEFTGGHFFINSCPEKIVSLIVNNAGQ